jgi:hypothetical protein
MVTYLSLTSTFCVFTEKIGVSLVLLQPVDEDPLMATVNFLELH